MFTSSQKIRLKKPIKIYFGKSKQIFLSNQNNTINFTCSFPMKLVTSNVPIIKTKPSCKMIAFATMGYQSILSGSISQKYSILAKAIISPEGSMAFRPTKLATPRINSFNSCLSIEKVNERLKRSKAHLSLVSIAHISNRWVQNTKIKVNSLSNRKTIKKFVANYKDNINFSKNIKKMSYPLKLRMLLKKFTGIQKTTKNNLQENIIKYNLETYHRSNQDTCLIQKPIIKEGDWIQMGDLLADSASSMGGELAIGHNIIVAYMPWEGYNYEDAILINERLVYEDIYTSIHIERYEIATKDTKLGVEQITRDIPDANENEISHLDKNGIAKIGSWVEEGDILVGKITPFNLKTLTPQQKLLYKIFDKELNTTKDSSLRAPKGIKANVINVNILARQKIFVQSPSKQKKNFLKNHTHSTLPSPTGTPSLNDPLAVPSYVHVYLAEKRKMQVGDKMAGRHGNKGIVSRILPRQDMPFLPDGTSVDIVLNPLGVPSRMNVGQIYECLLGLAGRYLGEHYKIPPFDESYGADASRSFVLSKLYEARKKTGLNWLFDPNNPGKIRLFDGRNSDCFDQTVTVGIAYVLKLVHMVDDKLHVRSTGPYSLVTQQPLRGRSKQGGQRLGEMEVWAIEGYGAAFVLSEMLTIKSDDMTGRQNLWKNLIENNDISLGSPESFKVLICELQALCLDIGLFRKNITKQDTFFADSLAPQKINKTFVGSNALRPTSFNTKENNTEDINRFLSTPTPYGQLRSLIEIDSLLHLA